MRIQHQEIKIREKSGDLDLNSNKPEVQVPLKPPPKTLGFSF